jgi:hypothetical protein
VVCVREGMEMSVVCYIYRGGSIYGNLWDMTPRNITGAVTQTSLRLYHWLYLGTARTLLPTLLPILLAQTLSRWRSPSLARHCALVPGATQPPCPSDRCHCVTREIASCSSGCTHSTHSFPPPHVHPTHAFPPPHVHPTHAFPPP